MVRVVKWLEIASLVQITIESSKPANKVFQMNLLLILFCQYIERLFKRPNLKLRRFTQNVKFKKRKS